MPEKLPRKSCDVGLRCEKSTCFSRWSVAKCLRFGLWLRFGLRCERPRCQIASDAGRAMRTTKFLLLKIWVLQASSIQPNFRLRFWSHGCASTNDTCKLRIHVTKTKLLRRSQRGWENGGRVTAPKFKVSGWNSLRCSGLEGFSMFLGLCSTNQRTPHVQSSER